MSNSAIPSVPVDLADGPHNLRYDMNALIEVERVTGKTIRQLSDPSLSDIRALVWAGLLHENPSVTPEHVGALYGMHNVEEVMSKVTEAWGIAAGKGDDESGEPPLEQVPAKATGSRSGRSRGKT